MLNDVVWGENFFAPNHVVLWSCWLMIRMNGRVSPPQNLSQQAGKVLYGTLEGATGRSPLPGIPDISNNYVKINDVTTFLNPRFQ
jgi:hypothetical protein